MHTFSAEASSPCTCMSVTTSNLISSHSCRVGPQHTIRLDCQQVLSQPFLPLPLLYLTVHMSSSWLGSPGAGLPSSDAKAPDVPCEGPHKQLTAAVQYSRVLSGQTRAGESFAGHSKQQGGQRPTRALAWHLQEARVKEEAMHTQGGSC